MPGERKKSIYSPEQAILLAALREERQKAGLSQADVARRLGYRQSAISKFERGEVRLDFLQVRRFCQVVNVSFPAFAAHLDAALAEVEREQDAPAGEEVRA